jgi:hypothetical protein
MTIANPSNPLFFTLILRWRRCPMGTEVDIQTSNPLNRLIIYSLRLTLNYLNLKT